jgi:predicted membrane-bound mannosyltransferase
MQPRGQILLSNIVLTIAIGFILSFLFVALSSINYPYHLEWMEGQTVEVVQRILDGKPLYTEPALEYTAFIYPPVYYYVAAAFSKILGADFFAPRLVSFLSAIGIGGIIYAWLYKDTSSKKMALIGVGLFYATYIESSRWLDVGRIDSFYVFLILSVVFLVYFYPSIRTSIIAGLLLVVAFFTKQNALILIVLSCYAGSTINGKTT